jgi:hypothetical protein
VKGSGLQNKPTLVGAWLGVEGGDATPLQERETLAVLIVLIDLLPGVAARGDVIERRGVFDA